MGLLRKEYLDGVERVFVCSECRTHLTTYDDLVSQAFQGHHGRAWLFSRVTNVNCGPPQQRTMTTGLHLVRDIYCCECEAVLGWRYDRAYKDSERYKENKFILERALVKEISTCDSENEPGAACCAT